MNNTIFLRIIGVSLVGAFFMPWFQTSWAYVNGWNILFENAGLINDYPARFIAILIPLAGLLIFICETFNKGNYPINKRFIFTIPLLTISVFIILIFNKMYESGFGRTYNAFSSNYDNPIFQNVVNEVMKMVGIGIWITLITSIVLVFSAFCSGLIYFIRNEIKKNNE